LIYNNRCNGISVCNGVSIVHIVDHNTSHFRKTSYEWKKFSPAGGDNDMQEQRFCWQNAL